MRAFSLIAAIIIALGAASPAFAQIHGGSNSITAPIVAVTGPSCDYNPSTQTGTDKTSALQAAINAAEANNGEIDLSAIPCEISSPLTVSGAVTIKGQGCQENWGSNSISSVGNIPYGTPPLLGSGFYQATAGDDVLDIIGAGYTVNLKDFCVDWVTPYASTGNGIAMTPPSLTGYGYDHSVIGGHWENVKVYGNDGNHYGFVVNNGLLNQYDHLRSYGGGGLLVENTNSSYQHGNSLFNDWYGVDFLSGSADGLHCGAGGNATLYLTFIKPQEWLWTPSPSISGTTPPTSSQHIDYFDNTICDGTTLVAPDWETNVASASGQPPGFAGQILNGTAILASQSTTIVNNSPASGTAYQNLTGTSVLYNLSMQLNPTGSAAATVYIYVAGSATGIVGSGNEVGFAESPATAVAGEQQQMAFVIPSGWWFEYVATDATREWSNNSRISGY